MEYYSMYILIQYNFKKIYVKFKYLNKMNNF